MKKLTALFGFLFLIVVLQSCEKEGNDPGDQSVYFYIPKGWPSPVYTFETNPVTKAGFELGRKLFYDPLLSRDSSIACGSCHQQFVAFAHADHTLSHGINGLLGTRNSPALFNMAWMQDLMWDGGVNHLEVQPLAPIANPVEMDETMANVIIKLQRSQSYPSMFEDAFGTDSITTQLVMKAFAQFMGTMISNHSKYDKYTEGKATFTQSEKRGLQLFRNHCSGCHSEPLLTNGHFRNNGLDTHFDKDAGRAKITMLPQDSGLFKVPSLRNIALTYPYMHDGRFQKLEQVLDHYASGIKASSTLDPLLPAGGLSFSVQEKSDIIAFLETLTDFKFISDKRFAEVQ